MDEANQEQTESNKGTLLNIQKFSVIDEFFGKHYKPKY